MRERTERAGLTIFVACGLFALLVISLAMGSGQYTPNESTLSEPVNPAR